MEYTKLADKAVVDKTINALKERNIEGYFVNTKADALLKIKEWIPAGVSVMNGSSRTLDEIGFLPYLKSGKHGWNNLHEAILAEKDPAKQATLRKLAVTSDYYLGSLHAMTEGGELLIASNSGSQLPHIAFTSKNIIIVAGTQKIVRTRADLFARLEKYVYPLEDERMKSVGYGGSMIAKILLIERENPALGRTFRVLLVNEKLGF